MQTSLHNFFIRLKFYQGIWADLLKDGCKIQFSKVTDAQSRIQTMYVSFPGSLPRACAVPRLTCMGSRVEPAFTLWPETPGSLCPCNASGWRCLTCYNLQHCLCFSQLGLVLVSLISGNDLIKYKQQAQQPIMASVDKYIGYQ